MTDRDGLPTAVWCEPPPYWGCPRCESPEWGAEDPFADDLVYRCGLCGAKFVGVPGIHHAAGAA